MSEFRVFFPAARFARLLSPTAKLARSSRTGAVGSASGGVAVVVPAATADIDWEDEDSSTTTTTTTTTTATSPSLAFVSASINDTKDGGVGVGNTRTVTETIIYSTTTTTSVSTTHTLRGSESAIHLQRKYDANISTYSKDLKAFVASLNVHMHGPDRWERRCDRYLVGPPHVGIKFRGGGNGGGGSTSSSSSSSSFSSTTTASTKLEMKIRKKEQAVCIEKWKKSVLAKSDSPTALADCIPDIISMLKDNSIYDGTEEAFFQNPVYLEVDKSRTALTCEINSSGFIAQEFCILNVPVPNPLRSGEVENEIWYSLCVEGDKDHIQKFLKSSTYIHALVDLFTKVKSSWGDDDGDGDGVIPVIGGYPSWVRFLGTRDIAAAKVDFAASLDELSSHIS